MTLMRMRLPPDLEVEEGIRVRPAGQLVHIAARANQQVVAIGAFLPVAAGGSDDDVPARLLKGGVVAEGQVLDAVIPTMAPLVPNSAAPSRIPSAMPLPSRSPKLTWPNVTGLNRQPSPLSAMKPRVTTRT
jgi:hypothetical protein